MKSLQTARRSSSGLLSRANHGFLKVRQRMTDPELQQQANRRRTFAIISHPDAGKTTLTEKFLLYGGALALAGSVTARKNQRAATSDWMDLEKQRGISISSTVLQFEYADRQVNLLDTPGHRDFSEDTYRVLTAVDAAVMVVDAGKGIESQTRKLFEVCRQRGVPIFTFMNKLDRPSRSPLELMDELEEVLGIQACAMNWPLGDGERFRGVFDRRERQVHLFERTKGGAFRAPVSVSGIEDPFVLEAVPGEQLEQIREDLEMLDEVGYPFDADKVDAGELSPVFFGSAVNNFGVQLLLDQFLEMAPSPRARRSGDVLVRPADPEFSGFIFKIQANMDPRHRDRIAFVRVVSGRFTRDMNVVHTRTGKRVRLSNSQKMLARDRDTVDEAFPGDIVGLVGHDEFLIGDTLASTPDVVFREIPRFAPECFAYLHNPSTAKFKQFRTGLDQLLKEGVVQQFIRTEAAQRIPLLAAVGPLQFEVVQYRLETEYGAASRLEHVSWRVARWIEGAEEALATLTLPSSAVKVEDVEGNPVVLFTDPWQLSFFHERNPDVVTHELPPSARGTLAAPAVPSS